MRPDAVSKIEKQTAAPRRFCAGAAVCGKTCVRQVGGVRGQFLPDVSTHLVRAHLEHEGDLVFNEGLRAVEDGFIGGAELLADGGESVGVGRGRRPDR